MATRVPELLRLYREGAEAMAAGEVPQGEPVSVYFHSRTGAALYVPAAMLELDSELLAGHGELCFASGEAPQRVLRGLLGKLEVRAYPRKRKLRTAARAEERLARRFAGETLAIGWARLAKAPEGFEADDVFAAADAVRSGFGNPPWQRVRDGEVAITGVVFPEEVRQGEKEDAWLFAVRWRRRVSGELEEDAYVARGERLTSEDLGARIPKLEALPGAVVAQLGLGAIGAPLALELCRNQLGELRLLEGDDVEVAQVVRWPFGLGAAGQSKLEVIAGFIERDYPYTVVERFAHRLGSTAINRGDRGENELELLERFLEGSSLVIDATAERGIQQLISDFSREHELTQLYASATEGARGGQIALVVPDAGGCWHCWKLHADEPKDRREIQLPPFDSEGTVQPRGCASRTFTGASFDLLPIVAQAARVAAAALDPDRESVSTVWVCAVPGEEVDAPQWQQFELPVHAACRYCAGER